MASGEPIWPTPMKAIGAQNLLTMPGGVTISGYLHKRGGKQFQLLKWPLRYVIIHKGCVYYFRTSTSASSQGTFSLNGYNRVMRAAEETTSSNVFPFKIVHISKKHRTWYFSAASEEERKRWMSSLRKEIDRYHEKKEAVTDLSDGDSDADSFYGSVERPVNIKYTYNPADESMQDDEDDDEEGDYEHPDGFDEGAPTYPPPPVPRTPKSADDMPKRRSLSDVTGTVKQLPPLPPPKKSLPDLKIADVSRPRKESTCLQNHNSASTSVLSTANKVGSQPPPLPPLKKSLPDLKDFSLARKESTCVFNSEKYDPGTKSLQQPPLSRAVEPPSAPCIKALNNSESKGPRLSSTQSCDIGLNNLKKELNYKLRGLNVTGSMGAPIPPTKPAPQTPVVTLNKPTHYSPTAPPNKPSPVSPATKTTASTPPIPPVKPKTLIAAEKLTEITSSKDTNMPGLVKPPLQKPPTIPRIAAKKFDDDKPVPSPILRSPPDGQSFRGFTLETPVWPVKSDSSKENHSDSDEDYEKVPLPASVYINTNESTEVERLFKEASSRGSPLNGLFCIRNSAKAGKVLVVWDRLADRVRNYRIFEKDSKVYLEADVMFPDVGSLVEHYYGNKLPSMRIYFYNMRMVAQPHQGDTTVMQHEMVIN